MNSIPSHELLSALEQFLGIFLRSISFAITLGLLPWRIFPFGLRFALALCLTLFLIPESLYLSDGHSVELLSSFLFESSRGQEVILTDWLPGMLAEIVFGAVLALILSLGIIISELLACWLGLKLLGDSHPLFPKFRKYQGTFRAVLLLWVLLGLSEQGAWIDIHRVLGETALPWSLLGSPDSAVISSWQRQLIAVGAFSVNSAARILVPFFTLSLALLLGVWACRSMFAASVSSGMFIGLKTVVSLLLLSLLSYAVVLDASFGQRYAESLVAELRAR